MSRTRATTANRLMARCRGICEICRENRVFEPHELLRKGNVPKDERRDAILWHSGNVIMVCRSCHDKLHASKPEDWIDLMLEIRTPEELDEFVQEFTEQYSRYEHPYIRGIRTRPEQCER